MANEANAQCDALVAAGLGSLVLFPSDSAYAAREASYWAANARLGPTCIVQPKTTADVSKVLLVLSIAPGNFAVRSGGHSQWAGGSDIHDGVTIDLGAMRNASYDATTQLVSVQPGLSWVDVYEEVEKYGRGVTGGRESTVGIAGFLTGGGNSYFTGRYGFGCDEVANFEVVLATGQVVNANKKTNPDLWKALKGGSGNFGIVTRFDLNTFPSTDVWGGMSIYNSSATEPLIKALVDFTSNNKNYPQDAHILIYQYDPTAGSDIIVATSIVDTYGVVNAPAFAEIQAVQPLVADLEVRTMSNLASAFVLPANQRNIWFTLTFKNDAAVVQKVVDLHEQLVADLKAALPASDFATRCLFQPLPAFFADRSVAQGGNVLGLDSQKDDMILWLGNGVVYSEANQPLMQSKMAAWSSAISSFAKAQGKDVGFVYLNYADGSQDPLSTYGSANIAFIRKVAAKYDPLAVFQRKVPGGFKISRI
ncbi:hypothetical protein A1O3_03011 [Capronia epimyces CBS 606.96]|uniref:FAD-binding PCMH-type domain-containing protein n=1 Tax=Capronia epimyces CBS 606.96 TaxID=1182542 RepID=W9Z631_9EURO|nr:uncharacterized protein A1O3_03011 [Capronia epimyces CBS 606.96]EXJ89944.1 hypothetical protein A1O3_03011 [Capronia epimyces CBS 606.96]